jgi:hypothetical protein
VERVEAEVGNEQARRAEGRDFADHGQEVAAVDKFTPETL